MSAHRALVAAVCTAMEAEFHDRYRADFVPGFAELENGLTRYSKGYVWLTGFARSTGLPIWEELALHVRFYKKKQEARKPESPVDPGDLYDLGEELRAALDGTMDVGGERWLLNFLGVQYDHAAHGAEATVRVGHENPFETGETTG